MRFDLITIFPEFFTGPLEHGIIRRAREAGLTDVHVQDLRQFAHDRHRTVDDRPFGGGEGMVLKPEPLFEAVESLVGCPVPSPVPWPVSPHVSLQGAPLVSDGADGASSAWPPAGTAIVLLSASGKMFRQAAARRLAALDRVILLCGRYEGVDERVAAHLATEELSIGDFVLSGGELAAALVMDAVTRLIPGALGNEASAVHESFSAAPPGAAARSSNPVSHADSSQGGELAAPVLLDWPHYTRPAEFRGWDVPEVLMGGNHEEIRQWRERMALEKTRRNRPDLAPPPRASK